MAGEDPQQVANELQKIAQTLITVISVTNDDGSGGKVIFECSEEIASMISKIKRH